MPEAPLNSSACHICGAALDPGSDFCSQCGASSRDASVEELRAVLYLLSELACWQADDAINPTEAEALRSIYERRRDDLRARVTASADKDISSARGDEPHAAAAVTRTESSQPLETTPPASATSAEEPAPADATAAPPSIRFPISRPTMPPASESQERPAPRRPLVETLAEPYTLRLLLYTGAAMFVVGIIIWLRDVLYLKLQEPVVQAGLLMTGTIALTVAGWYTILRTRQRLTGRALTLAGSLLVPVNFWFLVRSGLIANHGRAWVVCAFCTLLYAHTAALLRERLYVYLACAASVATGWALVYRAEPQAAGLYAIVLMSASLVFLHLSRIFPGSLDESDAAESSPEDEAAGRSSSSGLDMGRWSSELWSGPLVQAALVGASLSALLYMPLRLGPSLTLYDGIFRLRAHVYDSSTAMLLFTGLAYTAWFTGRYIEAGRCLWLYTLCALALLWAEFLTLDGLRLSARVEVLLLASTVLVLSLAARRARNIEPRRALYIASASVGLILAPVAFALLSAGPITFTHSLGLGLLAVSFALLSTPRLSERVASSAFAYASAMLASTAFLAGLISASLNSQTLFTAACAAWPFALYAVALLTRRKSLETQLAAPFIRTADVEFALLLLWGSTISLALYLSEGSMIVPRTAMFCALIAPLLYGLLRAAREGSGFGVTLGSIAALVAVASSLDALRSVGLWPRDWPIAAGVICAAFALRKGGEKWLRVRRAQKEEGGRTLDELLDLVTDAGVVFCALVWFLMALSLFDEGGFGAPFVLLLALVYWGERAASWRTPLQTYLAAAHAGTFFLSFLIALHTDRRWFPTLMALLLAPVFFGAAGSARSRRAAWLAGPMSHAAVVTMALAFLVAVLQSAPHLQPGSAALLAPSITIAVLALVSFVVSMLTGAGLARVRYFRAGLYLSVIAYALACLRAGFDPFIDVEVYTSPVAILLLLVAYISFRREWDEYARDTSLLFWTGSILLAGPLLLRALQFRLLLDLPAPARDLATLGASLALLLFGVFGRLRAPVMVGAVTLLVELAALTLTSVDWLQVPLKIYLVTVGALLAIVGWMFEYRREQLMLIRSRINERRETARERFGAWR
ncbi:MAG TPA: zinc ribbon domain-containing protein [Pyrinomonadaceae bacterium]|jgi:hypothetical protein